MTWFHFHLVPKQNQTHYSPMRIDTGLDLYTRHVIIKLAAHIEHTTQRIKRGKGWCLAGRLKCRKRAKIKNLLNSTMKHKRQKQQKHESDLQPRNCWKELRNISNLFPLSSLSLGGSSSLALRSYPWRRNIHSTKSSYISNLTVLFLLCHMFLVMNLHCFDD